MTERTLRHGITIKAKKIDIFIPPRRRTQKHKIVPVLLTGMEIIAAGYSRLPMDDSEI